MGMGFFNKLAKNSGGLIDESPILDDVDDYGSENLGGIDNDDLPSSRSGLSATTAGGSKINLKLLSPKQYTDAVAIADELMNKCIVVLDISNLNADASTRLIDFLFGVIHVLGGTIKKTNNGTFVAAPNGVDISELMPDDANN